METKNQMTEEQFIAKFKEAGFELYKTADLKPKLEAVDLLRRLKNNLQENETYEEATTTEVLLKEVDTFFKQNEASLPIDAPAKENTNKLKEVAAPLLKFMSKEFNPHTTIILTSTSIEVLSGVMAEKDIYEHLTD